VSLVEAPSQLVHLLRHPQVRKNHALEHATINLLQPQLGISLSGMSYPDRFVIMGVADPYLVLAAAQQAQRLLAQGHTELAVHARCGTTALLSSFFFAVFFLLLSWQIGLFSWLNIVLSVVIAWALGSVVSPWVQRYITTDPHVQNLEIMGAEVTFSWAFPSGVVVYTRENNDVQWSIR